MINPPIKNGSPSSGRKKKFLSVCSGIEAVSVAWEPLGFESVAYSEIEPFPSAVLARHYPDVPNLGDMTQYANWTLPTIDILAGGTPCQSFSIAGKRGGISDERGNLCLTFCEIANHFNPEWILWENVPGVLSSVDNAFGCLLGKLCGASDPIQPAKGRKHASCGVVAGPQRTVAWRVIDAQWFGVPQRRRRLFVLAGRHPGDWACADALLPLGDSLPGYFASGGKQKKATASRTHTRVGGSHWDGKRNHPTLGAAKFGIGLSDQELFSQRGACLVPDVLPVGIHSPRTNHETHSLTSCYGLYENQRAEMRLYPDLQPTLTCGGGKAGQGCNLVLLTTTASSGLYENHAQDSRVSGPLPVSPTVTAKWGTGGGNVPLVIQQEKATAETETGNTVTHGFPLDMRTILRRDSSPSAHCGAGEDGSPSCTLTAQGHTPGVCYAIQGEIADGRRQNQNGLGIAENSSYTLTTATVHGVSVSGHVRRLLPVECERLQGFPDNWTLIEKKPGVYWTDGHRYKAIGNSMAVPVIRWIGLRILTVTAQREISQLLLPQENSGEQDQQTYQTAA